MEVRHVKDLHNLVSNHHDQPTSHIRLSIPSTCSPAHAVVAVSANTTPYNTIIYHGVTLADSAQTFPYQSIQFELTGTVGRGVAFTFPSRTANCDC